MEFDNFITSSHKNRRKICSYLMDLLVPAFFRPSSSDRCEWQSFPHIWWLYLSEIFSIFRWWMWYRPARGDANTLPGSNWCWLTSIRWSSALLRGRSLRRDGRTPVFVYTGWYTAQPVDDWQTEASGGSTPVSYRAHYWGRLMKSATFVRVFQLSIFWTNRPLTCMGHAHSLPEIENQSRRSRVKVTANVCATPAL